MKAQAPNKKGPMHHNKKPAQNAKKPIQNNKRPAVQPPTNPKSKMAKTSEEAVQDPEELNNSDVNSNGESSEGEMSSDLSDEEIAFDKILQKQKKDPKNEEEKDEDSGSEDDDLNVEFELVAPCESFFHSIKMLVQQLCDDQKYDASGLADALIMQQSLGSLPVTALDFNLDEKYSALTDEEFEKMRQKHNNDRDVYGITSVINFSNRENRQYLEDIYGYIMYKAKKNLEKDQLKKFIGILNSKKVALFINERYLNLPVKLIPTLLKSIPDDIEFTKKQDDIKDPSEYDFDYFLGISKWSPNDLFFKAEEEKFVAGSTVSFKFTYKTREGTEQYKRIIYLIKYQKYKHIVEGIESIFNEDKVVE